MPLDLVSHECSLKPTIMQFCHISAQVEVEREKSKQVFYILRLGMAFRIPTRILLLILFPMNICTAWVISSGLSAYEFWVVIELRLQRLLQIFFQGMPYKIFVAGRCRLHPCRQGFHLKTSYQEQIVTPKPCCPWKKLRSKSSVYCSHFSASRNFLFSQIS